MRARMRLVVFTGILSMVGPGLYACSSADSIEIAGEDASSSRPATPTGGETGVDAPVRPDASVDPPDANRPPAKCTILESDAGNLPVLEPAACKSCAAARCCAPLTGCYGGKRADGGTKTSCQLFGECEANCNAGNPLCEAQCEITFGEPTANAWVAADSCLSGPAPAGCSEFCN